MTCKPYWMRDLIATLVMTNGTNPAPDAKYNPDEDDGRVSIGENAKTTKWEAKPRVGLSPQGVAAQTRSAVAEVVRRAGGPCDRREIHLRLDRRGLMLSDSCLSRALAWLVSEGVLRRGSVRDRGDRNGFRRQVYEVF